ncbi:NAD/NADP-dependent betaine aldehyde dehydrogenase [Streptomyces microflavus]
MLSRADSKEAGVFRRLADFGRYVIGDTYSAANEGLGGRVVNDIAAERGQDPFHCLVEICAADDLRTVLWPMPTDNDPDSWALRQRTWEHEDVMLGGSDAGAHLDRMCGAPYTTRFLGDCLRGRKLVPLTAAVKMLTDDPARLFGLRERGRIEEGFHADLVLFDPERIDAWTGHPRPRPARGQPAPGLQGHRDRLRTRQRGRDPARRQGDGGGAGDGAALGPRHPDGEYGVNPTGPQKLFIGGEWTEPADGHYEVVDPATEEVVGLAPEASRAQVYEAAAAAKEAFSNWSRTRSEERAAILDRAADLVQRDFLAHAEVARAESGATASTARGMQVGVGVARFRRYAKGALEPVEEAIAPQINEAGPMGRAGVFGALAVRRPVGVVTCITSYNNPWANPAGKIAPALAMGNTVLVKPAPQDPLSVYRMAAALAEAGVPPGVVNVVTGSGAEAGEAAVDSPDVDMVSFTGSTAVGQRIAEVCGRGMKRQLMELGGKGAALVMEDADLNSAVAGIGTTFSFYSGQICTAPTRSWSTGPARAS